MAQFLGLIKLTWRGSTIPIEKGGKVKLGGLMQKPVVIGQQVGFTAEYEPSEITVTTALYKGDALYKIFTPGEGPLGIECDTGQAYNWDDAFIANLPEFTAGDGGKVQIKWNAGQATELLN